MTIRELFQEFVIAKREMEDAHDRDVLLAWRIAMFERQPKLPPADRFFARSQRRGDQVQAAGEQGSVIKMLGEMYGRVTTQSERDAMAKAKAARRKGKRT